VERWKVELVERLAALDGAALGDGAFGPGPAVWVGRREVAHLDGDGTLDVRLTRQAISARRTELRDHPRVVLRPSTSDWLAVLLDSPEDTALAEQLVVAAIDANLPAAPPGVPPTGPDLERRRRFH
jgi:hypothetical protein